MTPTKQFVISTTEPFIISLANTTKLVLEFNKYYRRPGLVGIVAHCAIRQIIVDEDGFEEELEPGIPYGDVTFNPGDGYVTPYPLGCFVKLDCGYANEIMEELERKKLARRSGIVQYGNDFGAGRPKAMIWQLSRLFEPLLGLEPFRGFEE